MGSFLTEGWWCLLGGALPSDFHRFKAILDEVSLSEKLFIMVHYPLVNIQHTKKTDGKITMLLMGESTINGSFR